MSALNTKKEIEVPSNEDRGRTFRRKWGILLERGKLTEQQLEQVAASAPAQSAGSIGQWWIDFASEEDTGAPWPRQSS